LLIYCCVLHLTQKNVGLSDVDEDNSVEISDTGGCSY
jgi:hypothetical protein